MNNCIKVFVRPDTIKGHPEDFADKVTWSKKGTTVLEANNPTPFYLNIKELNIGEGVLNRLIIYLLLENKALVFQVLQLVRFSGE